MLELQSSLLQVTDAAIWQWLSPTEYMRMFKLYKCAYVTVYMVHKQSNKRTHTS